MAVVLDLIVPGLLAVAACFALAGKKDVYSLMVQGAGAGLQTCATMLPPLVILLTCIHLLQASGTMEILTQLLSPASHFLGIPPETLPLVLIRPISGSAALAVGSELLARYGPDSMIGRTAAVMLGSTETTFYIISVYFGAAKIRRCRYAIAAALTADLAGFLSASFFTRLFL